MSRTAIDDKLDYLEATKELIKHELIEKGAVIDENTTFREYAEAIRDLHTGASEEWLDEIQTLINRINGADVSTAVVISAEEYQDMVDTIEALQQEVADAETQTEDILS